ncbi:MAG: HAD-IB family hydrolase [Bowdeniella nasicola]|nr:HAD-IB family hydrolase [Bowdeniella nasicola]
MEGTERTIAAFFDVDNTLIRGASSYHLARELYRRGFFRFSDIFFAARHAALYTLFGESVPRVTAVRERALATIKGHRVAEIISIGEEVYTRVLAPRIVLGTKLLLDEHLGAGHEVWLVTATPLELSEHIAARLGATGALGSRAEAHNGVYTGRLQAPFLHGRMKAEAIVQLAEARNIDTVASYAYGDSINDVPLLESVGNPVAVNPEPRLRAYARRRGWEIVTFPQSRRRLMTGLGRGLRSASLAGALWAGAMIVRSLRKQ